MPAPQTPPTKEGQLYTDTKDGSQWIGKGGRWVQNPNATKGQGGQGAGAALASAGKQIAANTMGSIINANINSKQKPIVSNVDNDANIGTGNTNAAAGLNEQDAEHVDQSARLKADAQRGYQIGNRDERVEAQKDAASKEAHVYDTKINQMDAATGSGTAAFLGQNTQEGDINAHRQRSDDQRAHGEELMLKSEDATQVAIQERTAANEADRQANDIDEANEEREEIQPPPADEDPPPPDADPPDPDEDPPSPDPEPPAPDPDPEKPEVSEEGTVRIRNALSELFDNPYQTTMSDEDKQQLISLFDEGEKVWAEDADSNNGGGSKKWDAWAKKAEDFIMKVTGKTNRDEVSIKRSKNAGRLNSDTGSGGKGAKYEWLEGDIEKEDGSKEHFKRYAQLRGGMTKEQAIEDIKRGGKSANIQVVNPQTRDYEPWPSDVRVKRVKGKVSDRRLKSIIKAINRRFI